MAVDMQAQLITQDQEAEFDGAVIAGNVFNTHSLNGWVLNSMVNSYVAHNSVWTEPTSGSSIAVTGNRFKDNFVASNYFSRLDTDLQLLVGGSTWTHNATESSEILGDDSVASVVPGFANRYLILTKNSALLNRGLPQVGMVTAFGTLSYTSQIGAMPYHPDTTLASVLANVIQHSIYGLTTKNSPDGDFVAPSSGFSRFTGSPTPVPLLDGTGRLHFNDGTQSGLLAVI
jgi:hypothetical protein